MIRFCGKIKNQIQVKILDLYSKQATIMFVVLGVILETLGISVAIGFNEKNMLLEFFIFGLIIIVFIVIFILTNRKTKIKIEWDFDIIIENEMITINCRHQINGVIATKPIKKIKKVVDFGEYYYLYVCRWDASNGIICQKDLLIEGSLEEFEKLFEGKIQRKEITK